MLGRQVASFFSPACCPKDTRVVNLTRKPHFLPRPTLSIELSAHSSPPLSSPPSACQSVSPFEQRTTPPVPRGTRVPALPWTQHTDETFAAVRLTKGKIGSSQKQKLRDGLGTVGRRTLTRQALILPPQSSVFLGLDYGKTTLARYHQGKVFYRARQSHLPPEPKDHA